MDDYTGQTLIHDAGETGGSADFSWKRVRLNAGTAASTHPTPVATPAALVPTPTADGLPRRFADFATLSDALDYAAQGEKGLNFYCSRGRLTAVLSYAELARRAQIVAGQLVALGLNSGDRVALIAETSPEFLVQFMGCAYAAVLPVPLPLPVSFGGREGYVQQLANQLSSCDPRAVVGPEGLLQILTDAGSVLDLDFCGTWSQFDALPVAAHGRRAASPDEVAYLQYSSGSTRFPHGVAVTHRSLLENCMLMGKHGIAIRDTDRCVSWLPFYHDMGLVGCFLTIMTCQVSTDYLATEDFTRRPLTWLKLISENPGTTCTYSPTFGYDITARRAGADVSGFDLSRWRLAGNGGDMIRPDVMQRFIDTFAPAGFKAESFMPSYGLAECTLGVSFMPHGRGIELELVDEAMLSGVGVAPAASGQPKRLRAIVNCGELLPGYEMELRDGAGKLVKPGTIGRLFVRGLSVMQGYFRDDEATTDCLSADGWLDTGDMAFVKKGCLYIVGRAKDMIIINGKNHWPQDIEWAVEQLHGHGLKNGDIAAFGITTDSGEEIAAVLVQCRTTDDTARAVLKAEIAAKVKALTHVDCVVELVPPRSLPRTSSGKLSRSKARSLYLNGDLQPLDLAA
jgi:fatty-acyl-CoA synthase